MIDLAYAMGAGETGAKGGDMSFIIMIAVMFAIFYLLLIRPQQKRQKQTREMQANLSHGDMVITSGGIHGKVTGITDTVVTLEVAEKVRIKVGRNSISAVLQKAGKE